MYQSILELCQATPFDVMVRIEQVLSLYQELYPTLLLDHPQGMVKLLEGVAMDTGSHLDSGAEAGDDGCTTINIYSLCKRRLFWGEHSVTQ